MEKKREPNFTAQEKLHLLNIVLSKYVEILEDKKTDRASVTAKTQAWREIEKEYNSSSPCTAYRKAGSLKMFYENKKKELRKKISEEKKQRFLTGGGNMPEIKWDPSDEILLSVLNEKTVYGLSNQFDSNNPASPIIETSEDTEYIFEINCEREEEINLGNDLESELNITNEVVELSSDNLNQDQNKTNISKRPASIFSKEDDSQKSWKTYKPDDLKLPISSALKPAQKVDQHKKAQLRSENSSQSGIGRAPLSSNRRRPKHIVSTLTSSDVAAKYNLLLDKRLVLIEKQIKNIDQEQELIQTERKLKIELLQLKIANEKSR